jgi:hypothetical protein
MSDFFPDGYVPTPEAIARAAKHWFAERFNEPEIPSTPHSATKPESPIEEAVRAFSQPQIPRAWQDAFEDIARQTVQRLRNLLHQGKLNAYHFHYGRHAVPREFWATAPANGVLESGYYSPSGPQIRILEWRTNNYPLCLLESELDKLLNEASSKKKPFPQSKMQALVAALRRLDDLPNRKAQFEALCALPEFRDYKITDAIFREAASQLPRDPGRKSRRES